ncbi:MAG: phosphate ABC transporter permease subunit PstC, partial [Planctomycetes bacterium]|nr:phosphate ABC transporter permease subunit PstC [Planctomycetota bacterium]
LGEGDRGEFSLARLPAAPDGAVLRSVEARGGGLYSLLWGDGTLSLLRLNVTFQADGAGGLRTEPAFRHVFSVAVEIPDDLQSAMLRGDEKGYRVVVVGRDGTVSEQSLRPGKGLLARGTGVVSTRTILLSLPGPLTVTALNSTGSRLYLGTGTGEIISVDFPDDPERELTSGVSPVFPDHRPVTALSFLNGDYAVAVGDDQGGVSVWFPRREHGEFRFRRSAAFSEEGGEVRCILASNRDRGFFSLGSEGEMRWFYSTNGRELLDIFLPQPAAMAMAINDRADAMLTMHEDGSLVFHRLNSSHPEAGWSGFFRRLLYEGYEEPAYVWQSTGSDASEPKLSLVPLIWGSIKGATYALVFAAPIALAAAMYLSQFAHARWRARLKPAVEMLAAVPSVVIGFLAALWLAPLLERHLQFLARHFPYDQRNSLVIAIAMGFAVIPTIFSLAEDAISAVPPSLSAASLALGASKWQTVCRVVMPTASPGIFTAVMLGFGRAVGETMIVLMAAGNTPILSLSPFNGMRTLSANIAVEMPEAPVGGTLYRTLFLCALILFVMTLVINTAAEVFRHRLRRRYGRL